MKEKIRSMREKVEYTQEKLAAACGVDRSTVAKWETGESMPTAARLPKLAAILGCTIDELYEDAKE